MNDRPTPDLATRFATSDEIIKVDDHEVHPFTTIGVRPGDILEITRLTASRLRPQALRLALHDGQMIVSSTTASEVALWTTTAPRRVRVRIEAEDRTTVDLWNSWRFGGLEHAWLGNAGMIVQSDGNRYTIQCSDGIGAPEFTDLVVTVQVLSP